MHDHGRGQGCETNRSQGRKVGDFWNRCCRSFCCSSSRLLELGSDFSVLWRPQLWGRGGRDCEVVVVATMGSWWMQPWGHCGHDLGVVASSSVPQGVRCFHNSAAVLWLPVPTVSLMEGGRRMRNIAKKMSVSALHFHRETMQVKVSLPLSLSKLSKQNFFQLIERLI